MGPRHVPLEVALDCDAAAEDALVTDADDVKPEVGEDDVLRRRAVVGACVDGKHAPRHADEARHECAHDRLLPQRRSERSRECAELGGQRG